MSAQPEASQLRSIIDRILRLKADQDAIAADIKDIYAEAKGSGFDKTALGRVVAHIRKAEKDSAKHEEAEAIFELYLDAYQNEPRTHMRVPAREAA